MTKWLQAKFVAWYEAKKAYRFNPCDVDALPALKPLGRGLARLATQCPCCNGVRILVAFIAGSAFPVFGALMLVSAVVAFLITSDCGDKGTNHD